MKSIAILTGPETYLDHLGILSHVLEIPLIVTEQKTYDFAKKYYPDLDVTLKDFSELSIEYLAQNFDVIFETGKFWAAELGPIFELMFRKKMRFVFCPHGNSDKGYSLTQHVQQDIALVYGDHLSKLWLQTKALDKIQSLVRTGNYRYPYYRKHQAFYDALAKEQVFSHFKTSKPIILYAPTWKDRENPSSFFNTDQALIEQLSESFNLIVKLHPFLIEDFPAQTLQAMGHFENHPSVLFLSDFPPIYPLLARCDLYLGDYSSIGYDFLLFDKPLFFLHPKKHFNGSPLNNCGIRIPLKENIKNFINSNLPLQKQLSAQRQKVYFHAFGEEIAPALIRENILDSLRN